jgi:2-dehydro-3-deoxyphosphogluconate aldolase / (4S)-4-hydroxy-2-oxoglutarate aldolase
MKNTRDILALGPVMPVIVLDRVDDAVPLAQALVKGGIRVLEVTLRTPVALDCVRAIRKAVPDAVVGVGTLTSAADVVASRDAGAVFGVSPGLTPSLLDAAKNLDFPLVPGVMTPSNVMAALEAGFDTLKLFPAREAGGMAMLKALGGPFPQVKFCPTGGIDAASAPDFLALPNVACVGGSWLAPASLIAKKDWTEIERLARVASALPHPFKNAK